MLLNWTHTGVDSHEDYTGKDPAHPEAYFRVYRSDGDSSAQPWVWEASDGNVDLGRGYAATARDAVELAEAVYWPNPWERSDLAIARLNQLQAAYAKAKARIRELEVERRRLIRTRRAAVRALLLCAIGAVVACLLLLQFVAAPGILWR
jgi:hypothetical protein